MPVGAAAGLNTFLGQGVTFYSPKAVSPYMQRWMLAIQHELPSRVLMEVAYVGNRGTKLPISRELDYVPAQYLSKLPYRDDATNNYLTAQVPNPFYGMPQFSS